MDETSQKCLREKNVLHDAIFKKGPGFSEGVKGLKRAINVKTVSSAVVAAIFGCSGPALLLISAASSGGLTQVQAISWMSSVYFFGGVISIILALYYKMPICGAWSIPAAAMMISALQNYSINQAAGAYLISGLIVMILGLSGVIGKIMQWLPLPIVMGMIAGTLIRFGTDIVFSAKEAPIIGLSTIAGYLVFSRIVKAIPPVLGALAVGIIVVTLTGQVDWGGISYSYTLPEMVVPQFSVDAVLSISLPLAILVIGAENA